MIKLNKTSSELFYNRRLFTRMMAVAPFIGPARAVALSPPASLKPATSSSSFYFSLLHNVQAQTLGDGPAADGAREVLPQILCIVGAQDQMICKSRVGYHSLPMHQRQPQRLPSLHSQSAESVIVSKMAHHQILVINETHDSSRGRWFLHTLLPRLARQFKIKLALEAFAERSFEGGPIVNTMGLYISDPHFANLLRRATSLSVPVYGYDIYKPSDGNFPDENTREDYQAKEITNLARSLDTTERLIVFCGYQHARLKPSDGITWLAGRLASNGLDIISVSQVDGIGGDSIRGCSGPEWKAVSAQTNLSQSIAVWDGLDRPYCSRNYINAIDLSVYHPNISTIRGRANWLVEGRGLREVQVTFPSSGMYELIVQAVPTEEIRAAPGAVAADQLLAQEGQTRGILMVPPGAYTILYETLDGRRPIKELIVL